MDGFRERLTGRYSSRGDEGQDRNSDRNVDRNDRMSDRSSSRSDRYDRDNRYSDRSSRGSSDRESISIAAIAEQIDNSNRDQLEVIQELFDDARIDRVESEKAVIAAISDKIDSVQDSFDKVAQSSAGDAVAAGDNELLNEIRGSVDSIQQATEDLKGSNADLIQLVRSNMVPQMPVYSQNDNHSEEVLSALDDQRAMLTALHQDIVSGFARGENEDDAEHEAEGDYLHAAAADKYFKDMEEHVHKECVKCYRNVQSTLEEQNEEAHGKTKKAVGEVKIIAIISLILNVVTVVLLICQIIGII